MKNENHLCDQLYSWYVNLAGMSQMFARLGECYSYDENEKWMMIHFGEDLMRIAEEMQEAIRIIDGRAETECSGNVTKENIARLTGLGVDYISSGALTHSSPILDISMKNLHPVKEDVR